MTLAEDLTRVTSMSSKERQDCLRWIARQAEEFQVELMRHRFRIFCSLKSRNAHGSLPVLELSALYIAAKKQGWLAGRKMKTQRAPSVDEIKMIAKRRSERARKARNPATKRMEIARVWGIVVELRRDGHSFGAISDYLKKAHKLSVTRQYLHQLFTKWESEGC